MKRRTLFRLSAIGSVAVTALFAAPAMAAAPQSAPQGAAPAPDDVPALIRQLGDPDFRRREAATQRLKEIGKPASPALREALKDGADPEVCARADALLHQIERPRIPAGWFRQFNNWRRRDSFFNGARIIEVEQGGRSLRIVDGPGGVEMTVTGTEDGEPVNVTLRARDAADLRRQDPDAYEIFERAAGGRANLNFRGRRLVVPAVPGPMPMVPVPPMPIPRAGVRLLPMAPPEGLLRPPADDLLRLEARLRQQMEGAGVAERDRQAVLDAMRLLRDIQAQGAMAMPEDLEAQIRKYNALSDALRQKLDDLKLPGPGDALPPPARARLGVSVAPPDADDAPGAGVSVTLVIPDSRGAKLGLREGDSIKKVNTKPIDDAATLRRVLSEEKDKLVVEVVRAGETVTLREK